MRQKSQPKPEDEATKRETCFQLGTRYGRCAAISMNGGKCAASDNITKPTRCSKDPTWERGLERGIKAALAD